MKKPLFTVLIVLVGVLILGTVGYGGYTAYNYSQTLNDFDALNETKLINVNNADNFVNTNDIAQDVQLEEEDYSEYAHVYKKENITFLSNTPAWDENNLSLLADELYANKHGDEIKYVANVILNEGTEDRILGSQESIRKTFEIPISLYKFLPEANFNAKTELSEINLYQADIYTTVEGMAVVLSHEYGHHFTNYHFGLVFSDEDEETDYYKLRGADVDEMRLSVDSYDTYLENHMWYLVEFAAEDYVYFMGSDNAHRFVEFHDTYDKLKVYAHYGESALDKIDYTYELCRNGLPHENVTAGLPSDVENLEEYFYSFIDEEPPVREQREDIGSLNLDMDKTGTKEHKFTWDQPFSNSDVIYTLILYDEFDEAYCMLKTTAGNEKGSARFGHYKYKITKGGWIYTYSYGWDISLGEKMRARVSITFPDGSIMLSDPIDFIY